MRHLQFHTSFGDRIGHASVGIENWGGNLPDGRLLVGVLGTWRSLCLYLRCGGDDDRHNSYRGNARQQGHWRVSFSFPHRGISTPDVRYHTHRRTADLT
jgi:hypothetical protein